MVTSVVERPLIAHIVYSFRVGGLENGVVNLINRMPDDVFRHVVIAMTDCDPEFASRFSRPVECIALHKPPGHGFRLYRPMYALLRRLRPAIVHTRNIAALEMTVPAWLSRVPVRLHSEHGRDLDELGGKAGRFRLIRAMHRPFVSRYIALSGQLERYLMDEVGANRQHVTRICNGVDTVRFQPAGTTARPPGWPFPPDVSVFGTVGRLQPVKAQVDLVRAFAALRARYPVEAASARLVIVGDGPERAAIQAAIRDADLDGHVWLPGARADVAACMQAMNVFVLPSLTEGISNTILEAMACGVPVIATDVGGNPELVEAGRTGLLVSPGEPAALADAMFRMMCKQTADRMGRAARERIEQQFSLDVMVARYRQVYESALSAATQG